MNTQHAASGRIQGIIFDLDGTLVDSRTDLTTAVNCMRAEYGLLPLSVDEVASHLGDGARKLMERTLAGTTIDVTAALSRFRVHYAKHLVDTTTCYPYIRDTLKKLCDARIKCAVISNKPEKATRTILAHFGIDVFISPIIGGDTTPHLKPNPHALLAVARTWTLLPASILMVGDHSTDIGAARCAGMKSAFLCSGYGRLDNETPDYTLQDIRDICRIVGQ